jgi:hypothetical protein
MTESSKQVKKVGGILLLSACLCAPYAAMSAGTPEVEKRISGFY